MAEDLKKMYKTIVAEDFTPRMEVSFIDENDGRQTLMWDIGGERQGLRYGENPSQQAALYKLVNGNLVLGEVKMLAPGNYLASDIELLQSGKHPGKINVTDIDNALNILRYLADEPCAVIVKHNNPCGVAQDGTLEKAYSRAYVADRIAAFGGAIALNRPVDKATAEAIAAQYAEVVAAPEYEEGSFDILAGRKNLRIVRIDNIKRLSDFTTMKFVDFKSLIDGGIIAQWSFTPKAKSADDLVLASCTYKDKEYKVEREPTSKERDDLIFGWMVEAGVTSNSVLFVKDRCTVGIGTGEQDRVGVAEIARDKAYRKLADKYCYEELQIPYNNLKDEDKKKEIDARVAEEKGGLIGAAMVSDAFFPFRDGIEVGLDEGVKAVVQPGGSERDFESIEACNENDATMVFTGERSFKH